MALVEKTCARCARTFLTRGRRGAVRFYCSSECSDADRAQRGWKMLKGTCAWCAAEFEYRSNGSGRRLYCSNACSGMARRKTVVLPCSVCGAPTRKSQWQIKEGRHACCSKECSDAAKTKFYSGPDSKHFRVGRIAEKNGYIRLAISILSPEEQEMARSMMGDQRYVLEHRLVMAMHIGRPIGRFEVVHHINGVKTDNRPENLQVTTANNHMKNHAETQEEMRSLRAENTILRAVILAMLANGYQELDISA